MNTKLVQEELLLMSRKNLGKDISKLFGGGNQCRSNGVGCHLVTNEITIYINVLNPLMIDWISSNSKGSLLSQKRGVGVL